MEFDDNYKLEIPTREGYNFLGWYGSEFAGSIKYTDSDGNSLSNWSLLHGVTMYAHWEPATFTIYFNSNGGIGGESSLTVTYLSDLSGYVETPTLEGFIFLGYFLEYNNQTIQFYDEMGDCLIRRYEIPSDITLIARYREYSFNILFNQIHYVEAIPYVIDSFQLSYSQEVTVSAPDTMSYYDMGAWDERVFDLWRVIRGKGNEDYSSSNTWKDLSYDKDFTFSVKDDLDGVYSDLQDGEWLTIRAVYTSEKNCIANGSLITLADGTQKPVEQLNGDEELLVWNMMTGKFDSAPILFIDSDAESYYDVIYLNFSDGTNVKIMTEHAFWDFNLNRYVYLRKDAAQYVGHWFNKQIIDNNGNFAWTMVQLIDVEINRELVSAWSPVTYGYGLLCEWFTIYSWRWRRFYKLF